MASKGECSADVKTVEVVVFVSMRVAEPHVNNVGVSVFVSLGE